MQELNSPGQSSSCGCASISGIGGGNAPDNTPIPGINQKVIVRHAPGTQIGNIIVPFVENDAFIYELRDFVLVKPVVLFSNNAPAASQIGQTIPLVIFSGSITEGTYPIDSKTITPDPGGVDLNLPFSFQKSNVKRTTPGIAELHTVEAIDENGNVTTVSSGVAFKHAFYQGYSASSPLTQAQIKALTNKTLNDSIIQQYGGAKTYVVPGIVPAHIYWCGPVGTPAIVGATLGGFALPLTDLAPVNVTNEFDGAIVNSYWVKRTSNKFNPGTYSIVIS